MKKKQIKAEVERIRHEVQAFRFSAGDRRDWDSVNLAEGQLDALDRVLKLFEKNKKENEG